MSLEYPCIYYRENGLCSYGGDLTDANICVFGPCDHETPSRADLVRRMSDEELADFLDKCEGMGYLDSSVAKDKNGHCVDMLDWLQQPAEED